MVISHRDNNQDTTTAIYKAIINELGDLSSKFDKDTQRYFDNLVSFGNKVYNYYVACQYIYKAYISIIQIQAALLTQFGYKQKTQDLLSIYELGGIVGGGTSAGVKSTSKGFESFTNVDVSETKIGQLISSTKTASSDFNVLSNSFNKELNRIKKRFDSMTKLAENYSNKLLGYIKYISAFVDKLTNMIEAIKTLNGYINSVSGTEAYKLPTSDLTCTFEDYSCSEGCSDDCSEEYECGECGDCGDCGEICSYDGGDCNYSCSYDGGDCSYSACVDNACGEVCNEGCGEGSCTYE